MKAIIWLGARFIVFNIGIFRFLSQNCRYIYIKYITLRDTSAINQLLVLSGCGKQPVLLNNVFFLLSPGCCSLVRFPLFYIDFTCCLANLYMKLLSSSLFGNAKVDSIHFSMGKDIGVKTFSIFTRKLKFN